MSAEVLRTVLATAMRGGGLNDEPAKYDSSIHSWRCEYPDVYGPCSCFGDLQNDLADAITAHAVEVVRGLRPDIERTIHDRMMPGQPHPAADPREEKPCRQQADAVLAVVLAALGVR